MDTLYSKERTKSLFYETLFFKKKEFQKCVTLSHQLFNAVRNFYGYPLVEMINFYASPTLGKLVLQIDFNSKFKTRL